MPKKKDPTNKSDTVGLIFKKTGTWKRISISYVLIPYILIAITWQSLKKVFLKLDWIKLKKIGKNLPCTFLKEGWLNLSIYFLKQKNNEEKWGGIFSKYLITPILFNTINPVRGKKDGEYIINVSSDTRKIVIVRWLDVVFYWLIIIVIDAVFIFLTISLLSLSPIKIANNVLKTYYTFIFINQIGNGVRIKASFEEEKIFIVLNGVLILLVQVVVFNSLNLNQNNLFIDIICVLICIGTFIFNAIILLFGKLLLEFKKSDFKGKKILWITTYFIITIILVVAVIIFSEIFQNIKFQHFNRTTGYTVYLSTLFGSTALIGIFLNVLDNSFLGKSLLYYITSASKNIHLLIGKFCFYVSMMSAFILEPYFILYDNFEDKFPYKAQCYILIFSIALLVISTLLLLCYGYEVVYTFKNYTSLKKEEEFKKITKWFQEQIAYDIKEFDLELDEYAQKNLISIMIEINALKLEEVIKLFNTKDEFLDYSSENTVVKSICEFIYNSEEINMFQLEIANKKKEKSERKTEKPPFDIAENNVVKEKLEKEKLEKERQLEVLERTVRIEEIIRNKYKKNEKKIRKNRKTEKKLKIIKTKINKSDSEILKLKEQIKELQQIGKFEIDRERYIELIKEYSKNLTDEEIFKKYNLNLI